MKAERVGRSPGSITGSAEAEPEPGARVPRAPPFPLSAPHHVVVSLEKSTGSKGFRHRLGTQPQGLGATGHVRGAAEPGQWGRVTATQAAVLRAQDYLDIDFFLRTSIKFNF